MPDLSWLFSLASHFPLDGMDMRFMQQALLGLLLLCPMTAALGVQVVHFRMAFFSDAIGHSAFAGAALGLMLALDPLLAMPVFGVLVGLAVMAVQRRSALSSDTAIGIVFSAVVAFGLAVVSRAPGMARTVQQFLYGDILTITVNGQAMDVPYGTAYSDVDNGSVISLPDTDTNTLAVAINMGNFAETYKAGEGTVITVAMKEKAGYLEEYQIRNIDSLRTNDRADYASDEVFANFRPVVMGDIAEGVLYRSSSPVNPELGRNTYADALAEAAGIKTVLNLADNEETMKAYEGYADSYYATLNVVALDMGVDFAAEDFNAKLKTGLEYMIANEGPYLVHCNEGKDRAGFTTALLEALMGGTVDEIKADYMTSYENYYHVEKDSEQYEKIAESNIMNSLCTIAGVEESADLAGVDLAAAAETYLTETVGLSAEQVDALQAVLSGTAAEAEQAA